LTEAEILQRRGPKSKTEEYLSKAIEIIKECCADGWVGKYEKESGALS
jgi:hypothetical protein